MLSASYTIERKANGHDFNTYRSVICCCYVFFHPRNIRLDKEQGMNELPTYLILSLYIAIPVILLIVALWPEFDIKIVGKRK